MRQVVTIAGWVGVLLAAIVLAEVPPVRALAEWIDAREPVLLMGVAVVLALGFALFFVGILKLLMDREEVLTHAEAEDVSRSVHLAARPVFARASRYKVIGSAAGRRGADQFKLGELKAALRSGAVWRDAVWRRRAVTAVGALLLVTGIFAVLVVVGPPWLKVLFAGAFAFVAGKLAWGFARN